jgi:hypothetical protein
MKRRTESTRSRGFRSALIAGAFGAVALGLTAAPALADEYYYRTEPAPPPAYVYERERDRDRDHGAGIHLDTPIFNFGIGFH